MFKILIRWFQAYVLGYKTCPKCNVWTSWKTQQEVVLFNDKDSIYNNYTCRSCGYKATLMSNILYRELKNKGVI